MCVQRERVHARRHVPASRPPELLLPIDDELAAPPPLAQVNKSDPKLSAHELAKKKTEEALKKKVSHMGGLE